MSLAVGDVRLVDGLYKRLCVENHGDLIQGACAARPPAVQWETQKNKI